MMKSIVPLLLLVTAHASAFGQLEFEFGGVTRTYYMEGPDPIPEGAPLVFVLHGYTSSAQLIRAYSGFSPLAQEEGFVAVFPQGTEDIFNIAHWNANLNQSTTNDHGFLVALAQHLQEEHGLSAECTYACGMSNGGFMSYSLACEHPDVFSAIGSVTGSMSATDFGCVPQQVVPIVHLHGTEDETVLYDTGVGSPGWGSDGVPAIIGHWTGLMGTTTLEETALPNQEAVDATSVDFFRYAGAPGGQEFHHYRVNGGGHDWFGVWGSPDVNATAVLWHFFSAQCNGDFTGISEAPVDQALIERQGNSVVLHTEGRIDLFDLQGRWMGTQHMTPGTRWVPSGTGVRLLHATTQDGRQEVLLWN